MDAIQFIQDLAVILATAGAAGWLCQRLGLSSVVGYLVAGVVVGPFTPPMSLVTDVPRIEVLAQLGMVFLMFSIGLRLSLRKMQRLGIGILISVAASAGLIFMFTRFTGAAFGLSGSTTVFLAGMLMVSSSAIISKVLADLNVMHDRCGQTAMGVTVLEDVVAVVMLTILGSVAQFGEATKVSRVGETLGMMSAFVVLAGIVGLLVVPWLLRRMSTSANEELQTLGLGGLLFGLAVLAQKAGYSTALGAFLLGTIVAETPHRAQVERIFEGMRDIFSAVFFVAIGMQIDPQLLGADALPIVGLTVFSILVRTTACTIGLLLIGTPLTPALRTALMVQPIGEFTFVIAKLGVDSSVLPNHYVPLAVGLSLLTAFCAPLLARHSERIAGLVVGRLPSWVSEGMDAYHGWLERLSRQKQRNILWQLSRKRLIQVSIGVLFVTGLFVFAEKLAAGFDSWLDDSWLVPGARQGVFWGALTLLSLAPLIAIWRNVGAMALLYAEVTAKGHENQAKLRIYIEHGLKVLAGSAMFVWLASIIPVEGMARWLLLFMVVVALVALVVLRRRFIYWHSEVEVELMSILAPTAPSASGTQVPWLSSHREWNLAVVDCVLPDLAEVRGQTIRDLGLRSRFGATVVGIERQGYLISLPSPASALYPRDKVLLMGTPEQVATATSFLMRVSVDLAEVSDAEEIRMEKIIVPFDSQACGLSLADLATPARFDVQIAGILRGGIQLLNPPATEQLTPGDELLCLGGTHHIAAFSKWVRTSSKETGVRMSLQV